MTQVKKLGIITLKKFWNSAEKLAIHCDTEDKAKKLCEAFDKMGEKWIYGVNYLATNWIFHKQDTCYMNDNIYGNIDWSKKKHYKIYEFEDVNLKE